MGDEGCCLGKEVQETPCFGFFPQIVSIFCLKMITFETRNYFLEKGSLLSRQLVIPRFPSARALFFPLEPKNLRKIITGATNKDYLCVSKNLLWCLKSHSKPSVRDTCLSLCLTKDRLLLIRKNSQSMKETFSMKISISAVISSYLPWLYVSHKN